jgi:membrane-bound ClpP family serine protease
MSRSLVRALRQVGARARPGYVQTARVERVRDDGSVIVRGQVAASVTDARRRPGETVYVTESAGQTLVHGGPA